MEAFNLLMTFVGYMAAGYWAGKLFAWVMVKVLNRAFPEAK